MGNSDLKGIGQCLGVAGAGLASIDPDKIMQDLSTAAQLVSVEATSKCQQLGLSSDECVKDCMHYNHPLTLFADYPVNQSKLTQVLSWYEASASGIGWYDVGNPDWCTYVGGTYCFTPVTNSYDISQGIFIKSYTSSIYHIYIVN